MRCRVTGFGDSIDRDFLGFPLLNGRDCYREVSGLRLGDQVT